MGGGRADQHSCSALRLEWVSLGSYITNLAM